MKAILVKNDNFENIGFHVYEQGRAIFNHGISESSPSNYRKELSIDSELVDKIVRLIKMQSQLFTLNEFSSTFFSCLEDTDKNLLKKSYNLSKIKEKIDSVSNKMARTISELK